MLASSIRSALRAELRFVWVILVMLLSVPVSALASDATQQREPPSHHTDHEKHGPHNDHPEHGSMGEIGAKLANPISDLWAIQLNFQGPTFNDGDVNLGSPEMGGNVVIQPVMPIPLYGKGDDLWKLVTRPVIPIIFAQPIPTCVTVGCDQFETKGGIADMALEMLIAPPASATHLPKNLIIAAGLGLGFPTSTSDSLGNQQFTAGPSFALGWKTQTYTALALSTYFFSIGNRGDRKR